jgi:hypothetical protein
MAAIEPALTSTATMMLSNDIVDSAVLAVEDGGTIKTG